MTFDEVKEIIISELNCDANKVTPECNLKDDLGADSIDAVSIIMDIEDKYGISIDEDTARSFQTVADLVAFIDKNKK